MPAWSGMLARAVTFAMAFAPAGFAHGTQPEDDPAVAELAPELKRCYERAKRGLRRHIEFTDFKLASPVEPREAKARGKFTPRQPVDVQTIVKLAGEAIDKKTKNAIDAELWCGMNSGKLVAADIVRVP